MPGAQHQYRLVSPAACGGMRVRQSLVQASRDAPQCDWTADGAGIEPATHGFSVYCHTIAEPPLTASGQSDLQPAGDAAKTLLPFLLPGKAENRPRRAMRSRQRSTRNWRPSRSWPTLPAAIKAGILAMIRASAPVECRYEPRTVYKRH